MDTCRLGIFHPRYPDKISETTRAPSAGIQSAARRFVIFYKGIARLFSLARRADLSLESIACCRSKPASSIQTDSKIIGQARRPAASESGAVALQRCADLTASNLSSPSQASAPPWRYRRRRRYRGKSSPPNSSRARTAQYFYLCCAPNAEVRDREMKRWK